MPQCREEGRIRDTTLGREGLTGIRAGPSPLERPVVRKRRVRRIVKAPSLPLPYPTSSLPSPPPPTHLPAPDHVPVQSPPNRTAQARMLICTACRAANPRRALLPECVRHIKPRSHVTRSSSHASHSAIRSARSHHPLASPASLLLPASGKNTPTVQLSNFSCENLLRYTRM